MSYYVTNENSVLNINNAHLKVSGNVMTDVMKLGAIEFAPPASDVGGTVNFTNVTTGVTTSSNLSVGGTLSLGTVEVVATTHTLANTTANGNTTPHTVQFSNATTGIVTTANVEVGGELAVTGNVAVDTDTLFVDSVNDRVGIGTTTPGSALDVVGDAVISSNLAVGTNKLFVDTVGGTVGIGTTTPDVKLHVEGTSSSHHELVKLATWNLYHNNSNGSADGVVYYTAGGSQGTDFFNNRANFIYVQIPEFSGETLYTHTIVASNSGAFLMKLRDLNGVKPVPPQNTLLRVHGYSKRTDPYGNITTRGNVGIGTTSPTQKLDVNGVIKSTVPSWHMYNTNTIHTGTLNFTENRVTPQNCSVSLSTGRVTITTAGRYCVSFHAFTENTVAAGTGCQIAIMKSGTTYVRNYHVQPVTGVAAGPTVSSSLSATGGLTAIMDLEVDDYVEVNTNFLVHYNLGATFSGFMIG